MNTNKTCPQCGDAFDGRSNQTYCGSTCKQRAFQSRQVQQGASPRANQVDSVSLGQPIAPTVIHYVSETEVELEALRLKQEESLKRLEFEERQREREYEAERQERQFQQELEMTEIKTQSEKEKWEAERARFKEELRAKEQALESAKTPTRESEPDDETDESEEGNGAGWVFAGIVGLVLYKLATQEPPKPEPPKPLSSFLPRPPIKPAGVTGLKTDSKPDEKTA